MVRRVISRHEQLQCTRQHDAQQPPVEPTLAGAGSHAASSGAADSQTEGRGCRRAKAKAPTIKAAKPDAAPTPSAQRGPQ